MLLFALSSTISSVTICFYQSLNRFLSPSNGYSTSLRFYQIIIGSHQVVLSFILSSTILSGTICLHQSLSRSLSLSSGHSAGLYLYQVFAPTGCPAGLCLFQVSVFTNCCVANFINYCMTITKFSFQLLL